MDSLGVSSSPFGGIPRNWKPYLGVGGGGLVGRGSPFGGIPRNWKPRTTVVNGGYSYHVPPSGGSLEIGNCVGIRLVYCTGLVPPSGGSLEIGNKN